MPFYLDAIRWGTDDPHFRAPYYRHPDMVFDLRSTPDLSAPGPLGKRVLCFTPGAIPAGPEVVPIGDAGTALTLERKATLKSVFVLGENIVADTVGEFILELLVLLADPTGLSRWKPMRVGRDLKLAFTMGGVMIRKRVAQTDPEWRQTLAVERLGYARWRADAAVTKAELLLAGRTWEQVQNHLRDGTADAEDRRLGGMSPPNHHLKALGALVLKYGVLHTEFLDGLPDEGTLVPSTTLTDDFNRADADALGTASGGFSWVEYVGDMDIVTNRARNMLNSECQSRANSALSTDDHYSQAKVYGSGDIDPNVFVRQPGDTTQTLYLGWINPDVGQVRVYRQVTGTFTQIGSSVAYTHVNGNVLRVEADAGTVTLKVDGVTKIGPVNDANISGNFYTGLRSATSTTPEWDDFEAADLAAGFDAALMQARQVGQVQPVLIPTGVVGY